jgi:hypothetical protein
MLDAEGKPQPGICPVCGDRIIAEPQCMGMWSGCKPSGVPAGGGWFKATCQRCGAAVVAYEDVYDEAGNIPDAAEETQPELYWGRERA